MVREYFCTVCQRTVHLPSEEEAVCPVCASPLLEAPGAETGREQPRAEHLARNEEFFKSLNEEIGRISAERSEPRQKMLRFLCECATQNCRQEVELTLEEYESIRSHPLHFVVYPGHEKDDVERVVDKTERYHVVEKEGAAARTVEHDQNPAE